MISRIEYMQELKRKIIELPHVREITSSDMMFIRFHTDADVIFEISMVQFNKTRFAITFDIGVADSCSCIGNVSWVEFTSKDHYSRWEEIYSIETDNR